MVRLYAFLLVVLALSATDVIADDSDQTLISTLVENAKRAFAKKDVKSAEGFVAQLFERTTGFEASAPEPPEGVSEIIYAEKMCTFNQLVERIYIPEHMDYMWRHAALTAYFVVQKGAERAPSTLAMTECRYENGRLSLTARLVRKGIAWAKKLIATSADEARAIEQEYKAMSEQHPDEPMYGAFAFIASIHVIRNHVESAIQDASPLPVAEETVSQEKLVANADKGVIADQLEVARRLETGSRFRQNNAKAYFWYKRALKDGGGGVAKAGMDRILPHLTEREISYIYLWIEKGLRPY